MPSGLTGTPTERLGVPGAEMKPGSTALPYARIGPFELIREIGTGGMGRVYLATQAEPIRRQVALKLMAPNFTDSLAQAMFLVERQALAHLAHPYIAQMFEAGASSDGTLYFAMEWVDGVSIDQYGFDRKLSRSDILRLAIEVCRGVQHAHVRGVIHRDIKPANIMIQQLDGRASPKIIDFGIATAPGTGSAGAIGTPGYMSPEQADPSAILDARADVYALGVLILELLSQAQEAVRTTWLSLDATARERMLITGNGVTASGHRAVPQDLPYELRAILAKALRTDRNLRYSGAEALAEDLQRFLDGHPVHAVGHKRRYVVGKFVQRHRWSLGLALIALTTLLALLVAATVGWRQAEQQGLKAARTAEFLRSVLSGVDPRLARGRDSTLLREILQQATERVDRELADEPAVHDAIIATIAESYETLGEGERALALIQPAYERANERDPRGVDTLIAGSTLLTSYRAMGHVEQARALGYGLYQRQRAVLGAGDSHSVETATIVLRNLNEAGELEQARSFGEARLSEIGAETDVKAATNLQTEVAQSYAMLGNTERALALVTQALTTLESQLGADDVHTLGARSEVAAVLFKAKRYPEALSYFQTALPQYERIFGNEHPETLSIRGNMAACLTLTGQPAQAAQVLTDLVATRARLQGERHPETLIAIGNLASALLRAEQFADAEREFRHYLQICGAVYSAEHPSCAERRKGLGKTLRDLGRYAEAETELKAAYAAKQKVQGQQFSGPQEVAAELAKLYERWGKSDLAREWAARAQAR